MKRIPVRQLIGIAVPLLLASCGNNGGLWASSFTRQGNVNLKAQKSIPTADVSVVTCRSIPELQQLLGAYSKRGYRLVGKSEFTGTCGSEILAKNHGANIGCDRVIVGFQHLGRQSESRMALAAYTRPSVGFATASTNMGLFATASSFNPGTSVYAPQVVESDVYRNFAFFFTSH